MKRNISVVIFWGAIWGLVEATLGYVLHSFSFSVGWFFWFPLAFFFMERTFKRTGSLMSVLYTSAIAASIKLINFLLPTRIDKVINPAVSILLEGLTVFAVFFIIERKKDFFRFKYVEALTMSVGWRVLYCIYILLMPTFFFNLSPLRAIQPFMKFFILESITNSLIVYVYIKLIKRTGKRKEKAEQIGESKWKRVIAFLNANTAFRISLSLSVLALAFFAQWVL